MTASAISFIHGNREFVARSGALLLGALIAFSASNLTVSHDVPASVEPIRIRLAEPPPVVELPPPVVEPPRVVPPKLPSPTPKPPVPRQEPLPAATPIAATPTPSPVSMPNLPAAPAAKLIPEKIEAPLRSNGAAEGRFAQDVRARIEKKKVFPDTARDLGMSGSVEIVYALDRAGKLIKAEIAASSGYPLLDQAAVRAVRSATYTPFPEDAWIGEMQKEFRTKLIFTLTD